MTIPVLDKGYIKLILSWGSDEMIIESARMSTDKGFVSWEYDQKLLNYLYANKHTTPFEMCGATFEIKAPIFVFREWHRHRTQSYNEMSARYIPIPDEHYVPSQERILKTSKSNKQAQGITKINQEKIQSWLNKVEELYRIQEEVYQFGLENGVPKELARITMPVARYSKMRASANLLNWLKFLILRNHPHAQWEIQQYAIAIQEMLKLIFPRTLELFEESRQ